MIPADEVLDVDQLISWILRYTPKCRLHISGGEPLLRPDVEDQIQKLVNRGIPVTMTTNGMMIHKRPRLLTMPLTWIVTHHECNDFKKWRANADLIADKPHIACRLLYGGANIETVRSLEGQYSGLNFMWGRLHTLRVTDWTPNPDDLHCVASDVIHLIEPNGIVYPCNNNSKRPIGNIYRMTYSKATAREMNGQARQCVKGSLCAAYQSAVLINSLNVPVPQRTGS